MDRKSLGRQPAFRTEFSVLGTVAKGRQGFESSSESIGLHAKGRLSEKVEIPGA